MRSRFVYNGGDVSFMFSVEIENVFFVFFFNMIDGNHIEEKSFDGCTE